eukprot:4572793-Prymnesium_polylepis.1
MPLDGALRYASCRNFHDFLTPGYALLPTKASMSACTAPTNPGLRSLAGRSSSGSAAGCEALASQAGSVLTCQLVLCPTSCAVALEPPRAPLKRITFSWLSMRRPRLRLRNASVFATTAQECALRHDGSRECLTMACACAREILPSPAGGSRPRSKVGSSTSAKNAGILARLALAEACRPVPREGVQPPGVGSRGRRSAAPPLRICFAIYIASTR